jgi:hypothetical protein
MNKGLTLFRQRDSVAMTRCPKCAVTNYANPETLLAIQVGLAFAVCPGCGVSCEVAVLPKHCPEPLTADDLDRILWLVDGKAVNARSATGQQFNAWAKTFMHQVTDDDIWTDEQRAEFCDFLLLQGKIDVQPRIAEKGKP